MVRKYQFSGNFRSILALKMEKLPEVLPPTRLHLFRVRAELLNCGPLYVARLRRCHRVKCDSHIVPGCRDHENWKLSGVFQWRLPLHSRSHSGQCIQLTTSDSTNLLFSTLPKMVFLPLRKIIWELELLLNLVAAFGAISICISLLTLAPGDYFKAKYFFHLHHLASWIVLIVWTNLMLLIGRLPQLGCYSLMLTTVTKNFLKVMISFIFLVIGFALSFTLIFPKSEFFANPWDSFVRTIVMMIGEFEYTSTYSSTSAEVSL